MNLMFKVGFSLRYLIRYLQIFQSLKSKRADPRLPGCGILKLYSESEHLILYGRLRDLGVLLKGARTCISKDIK